MLIVDLQSFLETIGGQGGGAGGADGVLPGPPPEILREILSASRGFDMDAIEKSVKELERHQYESGGELVDWLKEQVDNLEYDAIAERLEKELTGG